MTVSAGLHPVPTPAEAGDFWQMRWWRSVNMRSRFRHWE